MSSIFANLKAYKGKFTLKNTVVLDEEDKKGLTCEVVVGDYATSMKFSYTEGPNEGISYYLELDTRSELQVGEQVSPNDIAITIYWRNGDDDVKKVIERKIAGV